MRFFIIKFFTGRISNFFPQLPRQRLIAIKTCFHMHSRSKLSHHARIELILQHKLIAPCINSCILRIKMRIFILFWKNCVNRDLNMRKLALLSTWPTFHVSFEEILHYLPNNSDVMFFFFTLLLFAILFLKIHKSSNNKNIHKKIFQRRNWQTKRIKKTQRKKCCCRKPKQNKNRCHSSVSRKMKNCTIENAPIIKNKVTVGHSAFPFG